MVCAPTREPRAATVRNPGHTEPGRTGEVVPRAVNSIMWRVGLFYVGSVLLLALLVLFVRRAKAGLVERPSFRLPGSSVTESVTIAFLIAFLGPMWNDPEVGRKTLLLIPVIAAALVGGWYAVRTRVSRAADQELSQLTRNQK